VEPRGLRPEEKAVAMSQSIHIPMSCRFDHPGPVRALDAGVIILRADARVGELAIELPKATAGNAATSLVRRAD
jgi:hypothetical protein